MNSLKARVIGISVLLLLIMTFMCDISIGAPSAGSSYTIYENYTYPVSIAYPAGWELLENTMGAVAVFRSDQESASDLFRENVNIVVQDLTKYQLSLDDYTQLSLAQLQQIMTNFKIENSERTVLDGNKADRIIYKTKQGQFNLKIMQIWCLKDNFAYAITFTAEVNSFDKYYPVVERMIWSFKITR